MTQEQIIEELKKLKTFNTTNTAGQQSEVDTEVAELDENIADYNEQIAALEERLANSDNYKYVNTHEEERTFEFELLEESFASQLQTLDTEDRLNKGYEELATKIFISYEEEIAELNSDIEIIERRLRKNEVAVRKNIGIKLTDEELTELNDSLDKKKSRIAECEKWKDTTLTDIKNYGELITANNHKREILIGKQEKLVQRKEARVSNQTEVDNFKLRLDRDELARLKAGVTALESRKEYITYNQNAEIDKLIESIQGETKVDASVETPVAAVDESKVEAEVPDEIASKRDTLIDSYLSGNEDLFQPAGLNDEQQAQTSEQQGQDEVPLDENKEEQIDRGETGMIVAPETGMTVVDNGEKEVDPFIDIYSHSGNIDDEREAEIEEAEKILKEKKKDNFFKKHWKKFVAAGLIVITILGMKSCNDARKAKDYVDQPSDISYTDTDDGIKDENEKDFNENYDVPDLDNQKTTTTPSTKPSTTQKTQPTTTQPEVDPTKTPTTNPTTDPTPTTQDPAPTNPDPTPVIPEPTKETVKVELSPGEKVTDTDTILNGNFSDDNTVSQGDEVGKKTDNGFEVKDYTEDGNAAVDYSKDESTTSTDTDDKSKEQIINNIEDFAGGDIAMTPELEEIINNMQKSRR